MQSVHAKGRAAGQWQQSSHGVFRLRHGMIQAQLALACMSSILQVLLASSNSTLHALRHDSFSIASQLRAVRMHTCEPQEQAAADQFSLISNIAAFKPGLTHTQDQSRLQCQEIASCPVDF